MSLSSLLLLPAPAQAQLGGSVLIESQQRFRGVPLSGNSPSLRATLAYDRPGGGYAGVSASNVELDPGRSRLSLLGYLGWSGRGAGGLSWEAGATYAHYAGLARYDYGEIYAGLGAQRWNLRLYHSPDYFGLGVRTLYAEFDTGAPLGAAGRVFAHLGALARLGGTLPPYVYGRTMQTDESGSTGSGGRVRYDARLGAAWRVQEGCACELQLAWVGRSGTGGIDYPATTAGQSRSAVVAGVLVAF